MPWIKHCSHLSWCYYGLHVYPEYYLHIAGNHLLLIFLLIGESSRHQAENQRLLFQQEIENSYRNYIFELEEMSQQIRLFRHEYQENCSL